MIKICTHILKSWYVFDKNHLGNWVNFDFSLDILTNLTSEALVLLSPDPLNLAYV